MLIIDLFGRIFSCFVLLLKKQSTRCYSVYECCSLDFLLLAQRTSSQGWQCLTFNGRCVAATWLEDKLFLLMTPLWLPMLPRSCADMNYYTVWLGLRLKVATDNWKIGKDLKKHWVFPIFVLVKSWCKNNHDPVLTVNRVSALYSSSLFAFSSTLFSLSLFHLLCWRCCLLRSRNGISL